MVTKQSRKRAKNTQMANSVLERKENEMFIGKILTGVWEEETIILKGMPKDMVLSARDLVVLEIAEYQLLKEHYDNCPVLAGHHNVKGLYNDQGTNQS